MKAWKARAVLDSSAQQEAPQPADAAEADAEMANDEAALHEFLPPEGADAGALAPPAPASAIQCSRVRITACGALLQRPVRLQRCLNTHAAMPSQQKGFQQWAVKQCDAERPSLRGAV